MAGGYNILPLSSDQLTWLQSHGIPAAELPHPSRFPTLNELQQALSRIAGFRADFEPHSQDGPWKAVIDSEQQPGGEMQTVISITSYQGDDVPHGCWFDKGWPPLIVAVVQQLAVATGPLVLLATSDGLPALVEASSDVATVLRSWKHTAGSYG